MSVSHAKVQYVVARNSDGTLSMFVFGDFPRGIPIINPVEIAVTGSGLPSPPPQSPMTKAQFQGWVDGLKSSGFQVDFGANQDQFSI